MNINFCVAQGDHQKERRCVFGIPPPPSAEVREQALSWLCLPSQGTLETALCSPRAKPGGRKRGLQTRDAGVGSKQASDLHITTQQLMSSRRRVTGTFGGQ